MQNDMDIYMNLDMDNLVNPSGNTFMGVHGSACGAYAEKTARNRI
jgi:hypothetical protein